MALSLAIIILLGMLVNLLFTKLKLPGILGMLFLGVLLGPYVLNIIDTDMMHISSDLRKIALLIILLRAGLGIKKESLVKVGSSALKMSCIPGILEGLTIMFLSYKLLGMSLIEGGMLGFIIAAVSPAVVVPQMLNFIDKKKGTNKLIPTLILASASLDDIFAITIFSTFLGFYGGSNVNVTTKILGIPLSIVLGIVVGILTGLILIYIFNKFKIRDTKKVLILLSLSIILVSIEDRIKDVIPFASLLGVMAIGFIILDKKEPLAHRMSNSLNKLWVFAEIILFVLVGAEVNISVAMESGLIGLLIISVGLVSRSIGVFISLIGSDLNIKERLFCAIAYIPKATVQAAMGAVPLASGVLSGDIILAISVLAIITTAPLGALGIKISGDKLLQQN